MDNQLKKLNKALREDLKLKKQRLGSTSKKIIIPALLLILAIFIIINPSFLANSLKREIFIANRTIETILPFAINKQRVNFLFLGIAGEGNSAPTLTDTIIIINSTPRAEKPIGISIPRDLLIKFPDKNYYTKINALYQEGGIETVKNLLLEITGLETDFYLTLDLGGVKTLIDKVGGIDIMVENDIYDFQFPAPYNSYEIFSLKKGQQHLDGETALKYIRTRYQPEGDFSRIKRQQQVISALKNKILSLNFVWNFPTILNIWKTLQNHSQTNIGLTDLRYAWNLAKNTSLDEIKFATVDTELLISGEMVLGNEKAYILKPKAGLDNYSEIKEYINQLINNL